MSGILLIQASPQRYPFNARISSILIVIGFGMISYVKQLYEAATFGEHAYMAYHLVTSCFCFIVFLSIVYKSPKLFHLIDDLDSMVKESK